MEKKGEKKKKTNKQTNKKLQTGKRMNSLPYRGKSMIKQVIEKLHVAAYRRPNEGGRG